MVLCRSFFLDLAKQFWIPVVCIWLDLPAEVCIERLRKRKNHPTFRYSPEMEKILRLTIAQIEPPAVEEVCMCLCLKLNVWPGGMQYSCSTRTEKLEHWNWLALHTRRLTHTV